ncbi:regulatory protein RecX [Weeksellaceae bacterium A-14]|uniref:regulatory protein RecX n=1 Tax=Daejeonia sp. YH14 TaxID=3439042 RepID=UPI0031E4C561
MNAEKKSYTFDEIRLKMAAYCSYQDRCHSEVEQKMRDFLLIPEARDEILLFLLRENFLNEERFTRSYIRGKFNIKHWGRNKIRQHLKQKGVSEKLISRCMDEIDCQEYQKVLKKTYHQYFSSLKGKGLKEYQKNVKTTRYLLSRGFEYDEIREVIAEEAE